MPGVLNGLDVLLRDGARPIRGKKVGVVCNQASVAKDGAHALDALIGLRREAGLEIAAAFGPQHGIWGHTQDNMIEWEGYKDPRTGLQFYSLYGEHREPTSKMLEGVEALVFDVPEVGARYYTFIWTLALCMKACEPLGIPLLVLDRVNPIGAEMVEGTVLDPEYASFVGLHPLPQRTGMTMGEIARYLQKAFYPKAILEVVRIENWERRQYFDETDLLWTMPSPNMPSVETALVYPGMCMLEGTRLSEGRGTTRPFETFGAPYVDGWKLADILNEMSLPGVFFRPVQFEPTFQKHAKTPCEGCFIHALDRSKFEPVFVSLAILHVILSEWGDQFEWLPPPYEYETVKMPFDILAGNGWLRDSLKSPNGLRMARERMKSEVEAFEPKRKEALIYK
jgi:uncharacterized protein YbbC (DUF1343 family)